MYEIDGVNFLLIKYNICNVCKIDCWVLNHDECCEKGRRRITSKEEKTLCMRLSYDGTISTVTYTLVGEDRKNTRSFRTPSV